MYGESVQSVPSDFWTTADRSSQLALVVLFAPGGYGLFPILARLHQSFGHKHLHDVLENRAIVNTAIVPCPTNREVKVRQAVLFSMCGTEHSFVVFAQGGMNMEMRFGIAIFQAAGVIVTEQGSLPVFLAALDGVGSSCHHEPPSVSVVENQVMSRKKV